MKLTILFLLLMVSVGSFGKTVLFLGDSLTEGYQLDREDAYPAVIEKNLKAKKIEAKIINGGVSGATTASGIKRLNWYLKGKPDIMVLALGSNDGLRGLKLSDTEKNLSIVIEKAQSSGIEVVLAGMKMPPNYGEPYRSQFEDLFPKLAKKYKLKIIPFLLEGVGGVASLNLADGIHPNTKGHEIMAKTVLKVLEPLL